MVIFEKFISYKCIKFLNTNINSENTGISICTSQKNTKRKAFSHSLSLPFFLTPFSLPLSLFSPYCALRLSFPCHFLHLLKSIFFLFLFTSFIIFLQPLSLSTSASSLPLHDTHASVYCLSLTSPIFFCHSVVQSISLKRLFVCLSGVFSKLSNLFLLSGCACPPNSSSLSLSLSLSLFLCLPIFLSLFLSPCIYVSINSFFPVLPGCL